MSAFRVIRRFRDLLDVNWGTFADQDVAQYDSASGKLVGVPMSAGGDLTDAVILAPTTDARNRVQATADDVTPLTLRMRVAQSGDGFIIETNAGVPLFQVGPTGAVNVAPNDPNVIPFAIRVPPGFGAGAFDAIQIYSEDGTTMVYEFGIEGDFYIANEAGSGSAVLNMSAADYPDSLAQLVAANGANSIAHMLQLSSSSGSFKVLVSGVPIIAANAAPDDIEFNPVGKMGLWYDQTDGASKLMVKARDAGGNFVTLAIPVSGGTGYVTGGTDVAVADGGTGASTAAAARTNLDVPSNAEVVLDSLFDANTILKADSDNTPAALTMGASTILARLAAGNIKAASVAEIITLLQAYTVGGTDVAVADGGTGASTAVAARMNLGSPSAGLPDAFVAETCPRWNAPGSGSAPTAGNVYVSRITLKAFAYTTASIFQGGTRAVTAANCFLGIYDTSSLALLASSADFAANINAVVANSWVDVPLSYTPGADGDFYMALLIGSAGTMPTVYQGKSSATASSFFSGKNPILADRHNTTGLTSLPATLTLSGTSGVQYFFHRFA